VARERRQTEQLKFGVDDDLTPVVAYMVQLTGAGDGWINLIPRITEDDERPTSLGFLTLFGGGSVGITMCTWIPGSEGRRGRIEPSLGITQVTGRRAIFRLGSLGVPIPDAWRVEQDHPRRGLILRLPSDEAHDYVLVWALRAVSALSAPQLVRGWQADIYLSATS
jgi:hypothetical protein